MSKKLSIAGFDYSESVKIARAAGVVPIDKPDEALVRIYDNIASDCLSKVSFDGDDYGLVGLYLFEAKEQPEENRYCYGLCSLNEDLEQSIIGLAVELFLTGSVEFIKLVFLHELAHRGGETDHNEKYISRFNGVLQDYFVAAKYHGDSAGNVTGRKVWAM